MKKSGHKSTLRLLKRLESSSSGGKLRPVAVAFRHRLAFTLLALVQGSGGGGGGNENDIGDFIDLLTGQQAAAGVKPENNEPRTGQPSTSLRRNIPKPAHCSRLIEIALREETAAVRGSCGALKGPDSGEWRMVADPVSDGMDESIYVPAVLDDAFK
jgi:hypothetical protein